MTTRSKLTYSLFLGVATLLLLSLIEGATRTIELARTGKWPVTALFAEYRDNRTVHGLFRRHPWLNVSGKEASHAEVQGKVFTLNSAGYRSPERSFEKPAGVLRVLCAGGSTTFDSLANRNETTWPWRLEGELRAKGLPVEVWNAGIPTWTTLENIIALLTRDVDLQPDLLVVMQGFNDLQPASRGPHDPTYEHGHAERMLSALGFELEEPGLLDRSVALERLRALLGRSPSRAEADSATLAPAASAAGLATYRRNLHTLIAVARAHGIEVVLVTQPLRPAPVDNPRDRRFLTEWLGIEGEAVEGELAKINRILLEVAAQEGAVAVDAARETSWQREDFWDPVHFATPGSDKLARLLAGRLAGVLRGEEADPNPSSFPSGNSVGDSAVLDAETRD